MPRLEIGLTRAGLRRNQLAVDDGHDHAVNIGQLLAPAVDAVKKGITLEYEAR